MLYILWVDSDAFGHGAGLCLRIRGKCLEFGERQPLQFFSRMKNYGLLGELILFASSEKSLNKQLKSFSDRGG